LGLNGRFRTVSFVSAGMKQGPHPYALPSDGEGELREVCASCISSSKVHGARVRMLAIHEPVERTVANSRRTRLSTMADLSDEEKAGETDEAQDKDGWLRNQGKGPKPFHIAGRCIRCARRRNGIEKQSGCACLAVAECLLVAGKLVAVPDSHLKRDLVSHEAGKYHVGL